MMVDNAADASLDYGGAGRSYGDAGDATLDYGCYGRGGESAVLANGSYEGGWGSISETVSYEGGGYGGVRTIYGDNLFCFVWFCVWFLIWISL